MLSRIKIAFFTIVVVVIGANACSSSKTQPPHYGLFLHENDAYAEMHYSEGMPNNEIGIGIPVSQESQPIIVVWNPDINLSYFYLKEYGTYGDQVIFDVAPLDEGILEMRPSDPLPNGTYCFVQGNPIGSPYSLATWCFNIGGEESIQSGNISENTSGVTVDSPTNSSDSESQNQTIDSCPQGLKDRLNSGDYSDLIPGANLGYCDLSGLNLIEIDLENAEINNTDLNRTDLSGANLEGANLVGSNLSFANISGANLKNAILDGIDFTSTELLNADFTNASVAGALFETEKLLRANISIDSSQATLVLKTGAAKLHLAWNPDGTRLLSMSDRAGVGLWDTFSGEMLAEFQTNWGSENWNRMAVWTPGGPIEIPETGDVELFYTTGGWNLQLWGVIDGHDVSEFICPNPNFHSVDNAGPFVVSIGLSPDGSLIAWGTSQDSIIIAKTDCANIVTTLESAHGSVYRVEWSPDGKYLASAGENGMVRIWDTDTYEQVAIFRHANFVPFISWSPDSTMLASIEWPSGEKNIVRIWDVRTETVFQQIEIDAVEISWRPDGKYIALPVLKERVVLVDVGTGTIVGELFGHNAAYSVAWSPDGTRLASGDSNRIRIFPINILFPNLE